jgi:hypothetical protein
LFECNECAKALEDLFKKHGLKGKRLEYSTPSRRENEGNIWHDGINNGKGGVISKNGKHHAVECEGCVYDNIEQGIPRADWEEKLHSRLPYKIKETDF